MGPCSEASRRFYLAFQSWSRSCRNQQCALAQRYKQPDVKRNHQARVLSSSAAGSNASPVSSRRLARLAESTTTPRGPAVRAGRGCITQTKRYAQTAAAPTSGLATHTDHGDTPEETTGSYGSDLSEAQWRNNGEAGLKSRSFELPSKASVQQTHHDNNVSQSEPLNAYRSTLAFMVNPVVVLTAHDATTEGADSTDPSNHWHGATLSSFTSLSMDPAYITFNIAENSRTLAAIRSQKTQRAVIHIMHDNIKARDMARIFSARHDKSAAPFKILQDAGFELELGSAGPIISHPHAIRARLECVSIEDCIVKTIAGKHICILRVDRLFCQDSQLGDDSGFSLSYAGRKYVSVSSGPSQETQTERTIESPFQSQQPKAIPSFRNMTSTQPKYSIARTRGASRAYSTRRTSTLSATREDALADTPLASEETSHQTSEEPRTISMSETVDDYLAQAPTGRGQQLKEIIETQRYVIQALGRQARGRTQNPNRKPDQEIIDDSGGKIKRFLAMAAVEDLEKMLDAGRVSASRIQFIESTIEQGQLALIEAGHKLMRLIDEHGIDNAENKWLNRKRLLAEEDRMRTALHRLREFIEEEDGSTFDDDD